MNERKITFAFLLLLLLSASAHASISCVLSSPNCPLGYTCKSQAVGMPVCLFTDCTAGETCISSPPAPDVCTCENEPLMGANTCTLITSSCTGSDCPFGYSCSSAQCRFNGDCQGSGCPQGYECITDCAGFPDCHANTCYTENYFCPQGSECTYSKPCTGQGQTCQNCNCISPANPEFELTQITPSPAYEANALSVSASIPPGPPDAASLDYAWRTSDGSLLASGSLPATPNTAPTYTYSGCEANTNCEPGDSVYFEATLYYSGSPLLSEGTTQPVQIIPLPLPTLSTISATPSPTIPDSTLQIYATIPAILTPAPTTLDYEWRTIGGATLQSATGIPVSSGEIYSYSLDCFTYSCLPNTDVEFHATLHFASTAKTSQGTSQLIHINYPSVQPGEANCGNGILEDGEQCDPALPNSCAGMQIPPPPAPTQTTCNSPPDNCACAPYTCNCTVTSYECGNGICEGAEPMYCANPPPDPASDCYSAGGTEGLVYIGFALTVFIMALAYMYSKFIHGNAYLDVWLRDEAEHLGFSVLFAVILLSTTFLASSLSSAANFLDPLTYPGAVSQETVLGDAVDYLDGLSEQGIDLIGDLTDASISLQGRSTGVVFTGKPFVKGKGVGQGTEKRAYSSSQELAIDLLIPMVLSLKMQSQLLKIIAIPSLFVSFLSIALFLRVLPFTRKAGNYLLALCFSIFVLLPILYLFFSNIHAQMAISQSPQIITDTYIDFAIIANLLPQAVFLPNIAFMLMATATSAIAAAIRVVSE